MARRRSKSKRSPPLVLALLGLLFGGALAGEWPPGGPAPGPSPKRAPPPGLTRLTDIRVVDGDTLVARVEGKADRVRLARIDTPELRYRCERERIGAERARQALSRAVAGRTVTMRSTGRGYYGRIIGEVYADGVNLSDALLAAGLARPYRGRRESWCTG